MATEILTQDISIIKQSSKQIYLRIDVKNSSKKTIASIQGEAISANMQIDAESSIRRTGSFSFYVKDSLYLPSIDSYFWLDKYYDVYVGYYYLRTQEILWYKLGTSLLNSTNFFYSDTDKTISTSFSDPMTLWTGDRNGQINATSITIPAESDIRDVIISLITTNGGISEYFVENTGLTIPYDLDFSNGATIYDVLSKIKDLYPAYECFFDINGVFVYQSIPTCENDSDFVDSDFFDQIVTNENSNIDFNSVRNVVTVWGKDGLNATWKDENPDSPYYTTTIGEYEVVLSGDEYDNIDTQELCDQRAAYEGWKRTRLNDGYTIEMLAVPWFDVNKKFTYTSLMTGESQNHISKNISMDIMSGTMTLGISHFYSLYPDVINTDFIYHLY